MLYCGDCIEVMKTLDSESIKVIVTSPPYNLGNSTGGYDWKKPLLKNGYDNYPDKIPKEEYISWQRNCISEMMRILRPDGAIFYNHKFRIERGLLQDNSEILSGFPVRQLIIWQRSGGTNFSQSFFLPTYEVIYLITKPEFKLEPKKNGIGDVWKVTQELNSSHPAPFPLGIPTRCIESVGPGIVLDPFMGSGTTAVASEQLGRDWIGIEKSPKYCELIKERVKNEKLQLKLF